MSTSASALMSKRPFFVWVILVIYATGVILGALGLIALLTGAVPSDDRELLSSLTVRHSWSLLLGHLLALIGMIQLYRMRRSAAYFLTATILVTIVNHYWMAPIAARARVSSYTPLTLGFDLLVLCYVWYLHSRGLLQRPPNNRWSGLAE